MTALGRYCSLIPGLGVKLSTIILAGRTVLSAVGACPPHDGVRRRWRINVESAVALIGRSQRIGRSHHRHRPGRDDFSRCVAGTLWSPYARYAAAFLADQLNSVPSIHLRCRMTASFRATATLALRRPFRLVSLAPQAFSPDHFGTRVSSTPAASNRYMRSMASPHFEIRPDQSISPEAWRPVVNPKA